MTANNIQPSRNPITGTTIGQAAAIKRHLETEEGKREAQRFQEYWESLETPESTLIDWNRSTLEAAWILDKYADKYGTK